MSTVLKLAGENDVGASVDELPRAEPANPMGYSEAELVENEEWKRLLRLRPPYGTGETGPRMVKKEILFLSKIFGDFR